MSPSWAFVSLAVSEVRPSPSGSVTVRSGATTTGAGLPATGLIGIAVGSKSPAASTYAVAGGGVAKRSTASPRVKGVPSTSKPEYHQVPGTGRKGETNDNG